MLRWLMRESLRVSLLSLKEVVTNGVHVIAQSVFRSAIFHSCPRRVILLVE